MEHLFLNHDLLFGSYSASKYTLLFPRLGNPFEATNSGFGDGLWFSFSVLPSTRRQFVVE